jgi:hypothetical protein
MGKRQNKYRAVKELPKGAMSVKQYANLRGCSTAYIYKIWRNSRGVNNGENFEIVEFQGLNFILT